MSDSNQLVKMANDIGNFFRPQPETDAVAGIANHIRSYWTRRMIEKLSAHPEGLDDLPRAALSAIVLSPKPQQSHGGDAG